MLPDICIICFALWSTYLQGVTWLSARVTWLSQAAWVQDLRVEEAFFFYETRRSEYKGLCSAQLVLWLQGYEPGSILISAPACLSKLVVNRVTKAVDSRYCPNHSTPTTHRTYIALRKHLSGWSMFDEECDESCSEHAGQDYFQTVAGDLVEALITAGSFSSDSDVRLKAIQCLMSIKQLPYTALHPEKPKLLGFLSKAIDDPKRDVRSQACRTRNLWIA